MVWISQLFTQTDSVAHIVFVYALVIAAGMALGKVQLRGISLGVTCVLFTGIAAGHCGLHINAAVLNFLRDFGLILFVFFIGLQVGPSFFSSFRTKGIRLNELALLNITLSIVVSIIIWGLFSDTVPLAQILGVYFGAVTNTPGLGATQEALGMLGYKGENIAIAYACAYPLAVVGLIVSIIVLKFLYRIDVRRENQAWEEAESHDTVAPICFQVRILNHGIDGKTIGEIRSFIGRSFICSRLLQSGAITSPNAKTVVRLDDVLRIVGYEKDKAAILTFLGEECPRVKLERPHSKLTSRTIRITKPDINGISLHKLHLYAHDGVNITRVFRAGMQLFPQSDLILHLGDRVHCVGPENALKRLADELGDQEKKLDYPNIISIFVGIMAGILLGSLPIAIPGMPVPVKLGLAGGPLIVAILLGHWGPRFHLITYTTNSANLMLRELGIAFFLASVGLSAGDRFIDTLLNGKGLLYMGLGLFITVIPVVITTWFARSVLKINFHAIVGLLAGSCTNPPTLAFSNTLSEKNIAAIAYSTVYPLSMFLRILSGQIILLILWSFI